MQGLVLSTLVPLNIPVRKAKGLKELIPSPKSAVKSPELESQSWGLCYSLAR